MIKEEKSNGVNRRWGFIVSLIIFLLITSNAFSYENGKLRVTGYLQHRSEFGIADAQYNPDGYTMTEFLMNIEMNYQYSEKINIHQIIRARYDGIYDLRDYFEDQSEAEEELKNNIKIRELYLQVTSFRNLNIRIGKQTVIWGETDGLRLMDIINPLDMQWGYLTRDFEDTRTPLDMVRLNYEIPFLSDALCGLELLWVPTEFEVNKFPIDGSAYAMAPPEFFNQQVQNLLGAGLLPVVTDKRRDQDFDNGQFGAKFTATLYGTDFSLNYLYSYSQDPVIYFTGIGPSTAPFVGSFNLEQRYPRRNTLGLTFNKPIGMAVVRGEVSYTIDHQFQDLSKADWVYESDYLKGMIGFDYVLRIPGFNAGRSIFISGQFFNFHIMDHDDNIINLPYGYRVKENEQIASLLMNTGFVSDTIMPELFVAYDITYRSWWINPELKLKYGTFWRFEMGANIFEGENSDTQHIPFAMLDKSDSAYIQIRRMF